MFILSIKSVTHSHHHHALGSLVFLVFAHTDLVREEKKVFTMGGSKFQSGVLDPSRKKKILRIVFSQFLVK